MYQAMISMGLLVPGDAQAVQSRKRWDASLQNLSDPKPTIAVLGAGISGLCIAYELKKPAFRFSSLKPEKGQVGAVTQFVPGR